MSFFAWDGYKEGNTESLSHIIFLFLFLSKCPFILFCKAFSWFTYCFHVFPTFHASFLYFLSISFCIFIDVCNSLEVRIIIFLIFYFYIFLSLYSYFFRGMNVHFLFISPCLSCYGSNPLEVYIFYLFLHRRSSLPY